MGQTDVTISPGEHFTMSRFTIGTTFFRGRKIVYTYIQTT